MKGQSIKVGALVICAVAVYIAFDEADAQAPTPIPSVWLQSTAPGTTQTGNLHVSGVAEAGSFKGGGANLTGVNADLLDGLNSTAFQYTAGAGLSLTGNQFSIPNLGIGSGMYGNYSIGPGKLSTTGALNGQSLMFDGVSAVWGNPGATYLVFPFHQVVDVFNTPAFRIRNTNTGGLAAEFVTDGTSLGIGIQAIASATGASSSVAGRFFAYGDAGLGVRAYVTAPNGVAGSFINSSQGFQTDLSGPRGGVWTDDFVYREYTAGSDKAAIPIAYGLVNGDGTVGGGTGNFTVEHVAGTGTYDITITGETYSNSGCATTATAVGSSLPRICVTANNAGKLRVAVYLVSGAASENGFHFITFRATPTSFFK